MDPSEIATYFSGYGVKGVPFEADSCPVSNWLRSEIKWAKSVFVSGNQASVYPEGGLSDGANLDSAVDMQDFTNVKTFIHRFDYSHYKHLIDE